MLSIERQIVEEKIRIGDLFESIGFLETSIPTDESGDSYVECNFDIEVLGEKGYHKIEALRWTKLEPIVALFHRTTRRGCLDDSLPLLCSPEHLVKRIDMRSSDWVYVKDLKSENVISHIRGGRIVTEVVNQNFCERLCDLQVSDVHNYYANDILSHNSHWLVMLGANALRAKKNVLHYTFELSELNTGTRYDSNLCDIDSNDIFMRKSDVFKFYEENKNKLGRLKIKGYPTSTATVYTLRAHIDKLALQGFKPDIVLIDYADIMRSTRQFDSLRHELKLIYEELRSLAQDLNVPIWTASQSNRDGAHADVIDETNMSEGYGKAFVADILVTISRKAVEKSSGRGRIFLAKNRAGKDGLLFPIMIDTARSKFMISGDQITQENANAKDENETKAALRQKWEQLKKDESIKLVDVRSAEEKTSTNDDDEKKQ